MAILAACGGLLGGCPGRNAQRDAGGRLDADRPAEDVGHGGSSDAGTDALGPARAVTAGDPLGSLSVGNRPDALRLLGADGALVASAPRALPWLEVGARRGGSSRTQFHDPRIARPPGVAWVTPARVVEGADGGDGALTLASEDASEGAVRVSVDRPGEGVYRLTVRADPARVAMLRLNLGSDDGPYVGFGERFSSTDARGAVVPMQLHVGGTSSGTNEVHVPVPFFVHPKGYGVFVRARHAGAFDVGARDPAVVSATFETDALEVFFFVDPDPVRIIARYTRLTGLPRLPPYWAHGHMQWRNAWRSREELLGDAARLRAEGIPTTTIWIDNPWQRSYNDAVFDEGRFLDPPGMLAALRAMGYRVLVWHTPYLDAIDEDGVASNESERLFAAARDGGRLLRNGDPPEVFISPSNVGNPAGVRVNGALVDFTVPAASAQWTERLGPLVALGVRAFKLDYAEDVLHELALQRPLWAPGDGSDPRTLPSRYPQGYHRAYRDALDRYAGGDGFLLVRASSWGGQSVCDLVWPGDLDNDFRPATGGQVGGLPAAVNALINLSASGFPSFASDTGGYRGGAPTREALLRWAEASALAPYMQLGGGGESHNPWQYDPEATALYREIVRLHDGLTPYWRALSLAASRDGTPPVRALSLAFPRDEGARSDSFAYLLGEDLYAAPVVEPGTSRRRVHIPPGRWVHWFTRERFEGPTDVTLDAPLGRPVLFVRQGAVIPMLAEDVVTLAPTEDPAVVDADDRASIVRARVVPGAAREVTLEDGAVIASRAEGPDARLTWTPGARARDLRVELDWRNRPGATETEPTSVTDAGGAALPRQPDPGPVRAGACAPCWAWDGARGAALIALRDAVAIRVR